MNTRQKAKYWKKRYEKLIKKPMPIIVKTERRTQTLKVAEQVDCHEKENPEIIGYIEERMLHRFAECLSPFVETEYSDTPYGLRIEKTLRVVEK